MEWYPTMLNDKQEKFAQAYVLLRNATEAAKNAVNIPIVATKFKEV